MVMPRGGGGGRMGRKEGWLVGREGETLAARAHGPKSLDLQISVLTPQNWRAMLWPGF